MILFNANKILRQSVFYELQQQGSLLCKYNRFCDVMLLVRTVSKRLVRNFHVKFFIAERM